MSIFEDKVYNEMDWLEAVCQPIKDDINTHLDALPNKVEVNLLEHANNGHVDISYILSRYEAYSALGYTDRKDLDKCFEFNIEGENITINTLTGETIGGKVFLIKHKEIFEEKEIKDRLFRISKRELSRVHYKDVKTYNANEICELLGLNEARKSRSIKKKIRAIQQELLAIYNENRWNIHDNGLSNRITSWVNSYLVYNSMAGLSNFCKLKGMVHSGKPIYSINEEAEV